MTDFSPADRLVRLADGGAVPYDYLVVAAGMQNFYFGRDEWEPHAPGLKTLDDATEMRRRILSAFEAAEREPLFAEQVKWLTFVVVGAGPTGLELAGTLAEIARDTLRHDFRRINTQKARILLLDGSDRVLPTYVPSLSASAKRQVEALGVEVRLGTMVTGVDPEGVRVRADGVEQLIPAKTVLWGAGVTASPLGRKLAAATGAEIDRAGRVFVGDDCSVAGHPNIFVLGDLAHQIWRGDQLVPGVAPAAIQHGSYLARLIRRRIEGRATPPFRYADKGSLATIGRAAAVADIAGWRFSGYFAWLAWLLIHIFFLIHFQNRLLVMIQWAWNYFTFARSARLITGRSRDAQ